MKHLYLSLIVFFFLLHAPTTQAQNLVPNPSFEDTLSCPDSDSQVYKAPPWYQATVGSSDYFNSCPACLCVPENFFGYQNARTGVAYTGVYTYHPDEPNVDSSYREYIEVKMIEPLKSGKRYCIEFYISLADSMNYVSNIGVYLSKDSIYSDSRNNLLYQPQIETNSPIINKQNWTLVSGTYLADGNEHFLIIGNFKDDNNSDTAFVGGGSIWGSDDFNAAYYYIDDVSVQLCDTTNPPPPSPKDSLPPIVAEIIIQIPNVITPNYDTTNDTFIIKTSGINELKANIYNRWGQELYNWNGTKGGWDGRTTGGKECPDGIYYYVIETTDINYKTEIHKGFFHLFR